jgi:ABC-3C biological conflict system middle component
MILPSKHLSESRTLIRVGAEILSQLAEPCAVSELWERVRAARADRSGETPLSFDWFVLALTFLYTIFAVDISDGLIAAGRRPA